MVAGWFATLPHGGDHKQEANLPLAMKVSDTAALLNVSTRIVKDARVVQTSGNTALISDVEAGRKAVTAAAKEVRAAMARIRPDATRRPDACFAISRVHQRSTFTRPGPPA